MLMTFMFKQTRTMLRTVNFKQAMLITFRAKEMMLMIVNVKSTMSLIVIVQHMISTNSLYLHNKILQFLPSLLH